MEKTIKMFLDDCRDPPDDTWTVVRTVEEAKALLRTGMVDEASLDHDLGSSPTCDDCRAVVWDHDYHHCACKCHTPYPDGSDLVRWMAKENIWPIQKPQIHSASCVGGPYMKAVIDQYGPYDKE